MLCRVCCRDKCYSGDVECTGHGFLLERKRRKQLNKTVKNNTETGLGNEMDNLKVL